MVGAYRRYVALSAPHRELIVETLVLMAVVRACLAGCSVLRVWRILSGYARYWPGASRRDHADVAQIQWAVSVGARRIPGATCLVQALTAAVLLQRRGLRSEVCLGVRKDPASRALEAHAWVLCEQHVVVGAGDEQSGFLELSRFTSS